MKDYNYPEFVVNGIDYGYILTDHQAEQLGEMVKSSMTKLHGHRVGLWLSRELSVEDLFDILGLNKRKFDYGIPLDWSQKYRGEVEETLVVWYYDEDNKIFGRPLKPYVELLPQVVKLIVSTWNESINELMENKQ